MKSKEIIPETFSEGLASTGTKAVGLDLSYGNFASILCDPPKEVSDYFMTIFQLAEASGLHTVGIEMNHPCRFKLQLGATVIPFRSESLKSQHHSENKSQQQLPDSPEFSL